MMTFLDSLVNEKAALLRYRVMEMVGKAGSGHPGGSLSAADIVSCLYFGDVLSVKPDNPLWPGRDRFVLSKGHAAPILYAALAERGFFPVETLDTLRQLGSILQGHPDSSRVPGVEISTGSLGQGLSAGVGMALAGRLDRASYKVWVLLGDGECQEGSVWEAAMSASHYKLDNLTAIVDFNRLQISGDTERVMSLEPFAEKWKAFGWDVSEVSGHDIPGLLKVLKTPSVVGKPRAVIAHTVKGKGVSFMEGDASWHGRAPKGDELSRALSELAQNVKGARG